MFIKSDPPRNGQLRVYWIPQIPMRSFEFDVDSPLEAQKYIAVLAEYDQFQLDNNIKPDYSNAGGLKVFDITDKTDGPDGSWLEWEDDEGDDIDAWEP